MLCFQCKYPQGRYFWWYKQKYCKWIVANFLKKYSSKLKHFTTNYCVTNKNEWWTKDWWNLKKFIDFFSDVHGVRCWSKSVNGLTIFIDQEFGEVPFDCTSKETVLLFLQVFVQWNGCVSIYVNLMRRQNRKKTQYENL